MSDWDWTRTALEAGGAIASGLFGILVGIWRAGRESALREQSVKDDYTGKIGVLEEDMQRALAVHEKAAAARLELLVEQFKESFVGLRRQIDDDRLHTEREFLRKEDFKDFREEYREDMRDIKKSLNGLKDS